jgi:hypothetical protein
MSCAVACLGDTAGTVYEAIFEAADPKAGQLSNLRPWAGHGSETRDVLNRRAYASGWGSLTHMFRSHRRAC